MSGSAISVCSLRRHTMQNAPAVIGSYLQLKRRLVIFWGRVPAPQWHAGGTAGTHLQKAFLQQLPFSCCPRRQHNLHLPIGQVSQNQQHCHRNLKDARVASSMKRLLPRLCLRAKAYSRTTGADRVSCGAHLEYQKAPLTICAQVSCICYARAI